MNSLTLDFSLPLDFRHYAGSAGSRFLMELRDNKRIMGTKCPECNRVLVPARKVCPRCLVTLNEFVEVSDKGTLITFARVNHKEPLQALPGWFVYGIVKLDGADTNLVHLIAGVDPEFLKYGMPVQAVFRDERKGSILDIKYFKPLGSPVFSLSGWGVK
ncbi:Zn-ribbon domain-containing OB-fold protein [Thermodesulfobacteriota bacterium]